jgi:urease accessory protein
MRPMSAEKMVGKDGEVALRRPAKDAVRAGSGTPAASQRPRQMTCGERREAAEAPEGQARHDVSLARLLTWLSPAFPVGGFSYSHALEWVIEAGCIKNAAELGDWIEDVLEHGAGRSDLIFLAEAWRAVARADAGRLEEVAALATAFAASAERRLETLAQGAAFLAAVGAVWPHPSLAALARSPEIAYPVAVGASTAAHGLPLAASAQAFLQAFAANLVSAGVRLVPLGQTDGLRVLARLEPVLARLLGVGLGATLQDVGGAAILVDIASMRHETQYTRLFRS